MLECCKFPTEQQGKLRHKVVVVSWVGIDVSDDSAASIFRAITQKTSKLVTNCTECEIRMLSTIMAEGITAPRDRPHILEKLLFDKSKRTILNQ
jgi:hypothetical protein